MRQSINLYSFPFQALNDFLDSELDHGLKEFYKSFENEIFGNRIMSVNRERQEIYYYKDCYSPEEKEYDTYSYSSIIKSKMISLIYTAFDVISEGINICFISNQSIHNYLEKIKRQFKSLLEHSKVKEFPFLRYYLDLVEQELNRFSKIDGVNKENEPFKKSPFVPKDNIRISLFHKLYDISINHELVSPDFPKEDFIEVFTSPNTRKIISFKCTNPVIVTLFETIKPVFERLNASTIDKSKRFSTKQGNDFNASKYNSTLNRLCSNTKINELKEELENLVLEYK